MTNIHTFTVTYTGDVVWHGGLNRTFNGSGDPAGCIQLLHRIVRKAEPSSCYPKPCAIGVFYQPTIDSETSFYALDAFIYALKPIDALTTDGTYVPRTGFEKAAEFCSKVYLVDFILHYSSHFFAFHQLFLHYFSYQSISHLFDSDHLDPYTSCLLYTSPSPRD